MARVRLKHSFSILVLKRRLLAQCERTIVKQKDSSSFFRFTSVMSPLRVTQVKLAYSYKAIQI